jgi:glutaminase
MQVSEATRAIFAAFDTDGSHTVSKQLFIRFLANRGLLECDQRLESMFKYLNSYGVAGEDAMLTLEQFNEAISDARTLIDKCVNGKLRVPDFKKFTEIFAEVYDTVLPNTGGANADYIPQLAQVDPNQFGISVTTVDGQQFSIGDTDRQFCIQSCSKPLSYLIAQTELGPEYVHNHVGCEPSGRAFNEMCLKSSPTAENPNREIPHNPCINAGAMMTMSMVYPDYNRKARLEKIMGVWKALSGGDDAPIGYDDPTYKSESGSADRNWCLGYMMKGSGAFPPCFSTLDDTLELYFQVCSILNTNEGMAIMAATLANGGLNPLTGKRVFSADHVRNALPIMLSSGMYDYSGQWAYDVGVPAKSGVGGCVFFVVPNVCGISIWSPRLDEVGNSTRGVAVATALVKHFAFHNFEVFSGLSQTKLNPTERHDAAKHAVLGELLFAASQGDVHALKAQANAGVDMFQSDYDQRTALHLAASEGHVDAVKFLVNSAPGGMDGMSSTVSAMDRWGGTPLSDAIQGHFDACIAVLQTANAVEGKPSALHNGSVGDAMAHPSPTAPEILFAAANGDLEEFITFKASGRDLTVCDYDRRTALHVAASEGHLDVVRYLCVQAGDKAELLKNALDRFGGNPHSDAVREGHDEVAAYLASSHA